MSLIRCKKCGAIVSNRFQNCIECNAIIDEYKPLEVCIEDKLVEKKEHKFNPLLLLVVPFILIAGLFIYRYIGLSTVDIPIVEIRNLPVPKDTRSYKGKKVYDVEKELRDAGFTNIVKKESERKWAQNIIIWDSNKVEKVFFDSNDFDVKAGAEYPSNTKIIIYYFPER